MVRGSGLGFRLSPVTVTVTVTVRFMFRVRVRDWVRVIVTGEGCEGCSGVDSC